MCEMGMLFSEHTMFENIAFLLSKESEYNLRRMARVLSAYTTRKSSVWEKHKFCTLVFNDGNANKGSIVLRLEMFLQATRL